MRILDKLPSNIDLIKPVLVGFLAVEPDEAMFDALAKKAAGSLRFRNCLMEIVANPVLDENIRANAAYALGIGAREHRFRITNCKPAFERLLSSSNNEVRFCGALGLMYSCNEFLPNRAIERLSDLLLDNKYGWVAAEVLLKDLSACAELRVKHDTLVEAIVNNYAPSIRSDNPLPCTLRMRMMSVLEKLSH
jgi:hypothetical protein